MQIALRSSFGPLPDGPVPEGSSAAHPECQSAVLCSRLFEASKEPTKGAAALDLLEEYKVAGLDVCDARSESLRSESLHESLRRPGPGPRAVTTFALPVLLTLALNRLDLLLLVTPRHDRAADGNAQVKHISGTVHPERKHSRSAGLLVHIPKRHDGVAHKLIAIAVLVELK